MALVDLRCQACSQSEHENCSGAVFIRLCESDGSEGKGMTRFPCQCSGEFAQGVSVKAGDLYLDTRGRVKERTKRWIRRTSSCGLMKAEIEAGTAPKGPRKAKPKASAVKVSAKGGTIAALNAIAKARR